MSKKICKKKKKLQMQLYENHSFVGPREEE